MERLKTAVEILNGLDMRVYAFLFVVGGAILYGIGQHEGAAALVSGGLAIMEGKRS